MPSPLAPSGGDTAFAAFFLLVTAFIVVGLVASVVVAVRKRNVLRDAGLDPFTAEEQVLGQVHRSQALAPERTAESRLAEAVDLHRRGLITADELGEMRQRILGEV
jgi:hypothetical protein